MDIAIPISLELEILLTKLYLVQLKYFDSNLFTLLTLTPNLNHSIHSQFLVHWIDFSPQRFILGGFPRSYCLQIQRYYFLNSHQPYPKAFQEYFFGWWKLKIFQSVLICIWKPFCCDYNKLSLYNLFFKKKYNKNLYGSTDFNIKFLFEINESQPQFLT